MRPMLEAFMDIAAHEASGWIVDPEAIPGSVPEAPPLPPNSFSTSWERGDDYMTLGFTLDGLFVHVFLAISTICEEPAHELPTVEVFSRLRAPFGEGLRQNEQERVGFELPGRNWYATFRLAEPVEPQKSN